MISAEPYAPINVRILSTYPAQDSLPEETFDLTFRLKRSFASRPSGAHERIMAALAMGEGFAIPVEGEKTPHEFSADVVREVWVW